MRKNQAQRGIDSEEFQKQFTPDGKINFQARVGLDKERDPFRQINYPKDSVEAVAFDEHRHFQEPSYKHSVSNYDNDDGDDDGFSEVW